MSREAALDFSPGRQPWERCCFGTSSPEGAADRLPPLQGFVLPLNPEPRAENVWANCSDGLFPSLHHRKEGWLRLQ